VKRHFIQVGYSGSEPEEEFLGHLVVYNQGMVPGKRSRSLAAFSVCLLTTAFLPSASAGEQHQNANVYAFWTYDTENGFRDVAQSVKIRRKAPTTFWAQYWRWNGADVGGYVGLQTDGNRFDGTTGDTAIFSLLDADAAEGPGCGTFAGEGEGYSCRLALPIRTKRTYKFRVIRADATEQGQWWKASVRDVTEGKTYPIGRVRVAKTFTLMGHPMNFSEYFGPAVECDSVPVSVALWGSPVANKKRDGSGHRYGSTRGTSTRGECTGGGVEPHRFGTQGVKITEGGPL